MINWVKRI